MMRRPALNPPGSLLSPLSCARAQLVLLLAVAVAGTAPQAAAQASQATQVPEVINLGGAPFALAPVSPASSGPASPAPLSRGTSRTPSATPRNPGGEPLSLRFLLENTGAGALERVGLEAVVVTAGGALKGYEVFELPVALPAGQQSYGEYTSSGLQVGPGDRVVLLAYSAAGSAGRWQVGSALRREVESSILNLSGEVGFQVPLTPEHQQLPPGAPTLGADDCASACDTDRQSCVSFCRCGMSSHHCFCNGDGTATFTCACFPCPTK